MHIKSLNEWLEHHNLNEKYLTFSDLKNINLKNIEQDARREVLSVIPFDQTDEYEKQVVSFKDMSDPDKGIKFEAKLKTGDVIHIFKVSGYLPKLSTWEWYLNGKKSTKENIIEILVDKFFTPFEKWEREFDKIPADYDKYDGRSYKLAKAQDDYVNSLYQKLSSGDKKRADQYKAVVTLTK